MMGEPQSDQLLSFYDVKSRLGLSPGMLLDALNEGKIRTNFQQQLQEHDNTYQYNKYEYAEIGEPCPPRDDFFTEQNVKDVHIHPLDLEEALEKYPELNRNSKNAKEESGTERPIRGIPWTDNSVWLSIEDLMCRWNVKLFDVISRLREGELQSNKHNKSMYTGNMFLDLHISSHERYPENVINEVACNLENHIWPYESRHPALKNAAMAYYNDYAKRYGKPELKSGQVNQVDIDTDLEWMPAHEVRVVIGKTPINFVNLLNTGVFETDREQERIDFAKSGGWEVNNVPFFKTSDLGALKIHRLSFEEYMSENYALRKLDSKILDYYTSKDAPSDDKLFDDSHRIAELEAKIAELEAAKASEEMADQNGKPRTAPATEAAQASRVEEWKGYAVVMAKVAYDCGLKDRKQVTRSEYKQMAKGHGALSGQALELLRDALPEGVTKKTGGPASQG